MKYLLVYIFGKTFFLYEKIYDDKDFPQHFSSSIIAILLILSIAVLVDLVIYQVDPLLTIVFYHYYRYAAVAIMFFSWWFFHPKKRYLKIVKGYQTMSSRKKKIFGFISVVYILMLLFIYFRMSDLVRAYNLGT